MKIRIRGLHHDFRLFDDQKIFDKKSPFYKRKKKVKFFQKNIFNKRRNYIFGSGQSED